MVLEWLVLPPPTPHLLLGHCHHHNKDSMIFRLGPRYASVVPTSWGVESGPWEPRNAFLRLKPCCHHPFL